MTRIPRYSLLMVPLVGALVLIGCSSSSDSSTSKMDTGGTAGNGGSSTATAGTDSGGDSSLGGVSGEGGTSPSGGTSNAGAGGDTGGSGDVGGSYPGGFGGDTGGEAGAGGGAAGATDHGVQGDPGVTGDGNQEQGAGPYGEPPEVTGHVNGAPTGTLLGPNLYPSKGLYPDYKFQYWIYVPSQYQPGKPAALMVFQDAIHYLGMTDAHFNTPTVFDNLINSGEMPVTIGLFITTGTPDGTFDFDSQRLIREMEYSTYNETYARFLLEEIIPDVITSQYDVVTDADGWAIGGQSSGGLCALNVGMFRSDNFHKILTENGAFDNAGTAYPDAITNSPVLPLRIYLLSGTGDIPITYMFNQEVIAALAQKGYHYRYLQGDGGHFPPLQAVSDYPNALRWLWSKYTLPWYP